MTVDADGESASSGELNAGSMMAVRSGSFPLSTGPGGVWRHVPCRYPGSRYSSAVRCQIVPVVLTISV